MIPVAGYCRVSTDHDDQINSFLAQQRFFREYITRNPEWQLYKIYADEGITGTSTKKRVQFNRMINDAYDGKFRILLTKEVSRFSRNLLDTISYTRELKALGVIVIFLNDGLSTNQPDSELRLSIMASIAQEESRKTSSRVTWGQVRQMERGVVFGRAMLGYDVSDGKLIIDPAGAELVRLIFQKYAVEKIGTTRLARFLREEGYKTNRGGTGWTPSRIVKILKNEKYVGDLVQRKTYTPDYLTHAKKTNHGQVEKIVLKDHHSPIVSREIWELAQQELQKNNKHGNVSSKCSNRYPFSGKIRCGMCGSGFVCRVKRNRDGSSYRRWCCGKAVKEGCTVSLDAEGKPIGCDVGRLLRDDTAWEMVKLALNALDYPREKLAMLVTDIAITAIREERSRIGEEAKTKIFHAVTDLLKGEKKSNLFLRLLPVSIAVYKDRHMELSFRSLPQVFYFEDAFY